jgi:hypothetical protein
VTSPLRGPHKHKKEAASPPLISQAGRAGYGAAPPASRVLRIALRATALRAALDPGDHCGPWGQEQRAGPGLARQLARHANPAVAGVSAHPQLEGPGGKGSLPVSDIGDDVAYDDVVLGQGRTKPSPLRLVGVVPGVLQPRYGRCASASPEVTGEVLADIRDKAYALVVVARRTALVVTGPQVPAQVCHRADLHKRFLDEEQARVGCGVPAMLSTTAHLCILHQVAPYAPALPVSTGQR